MSSSCWPKLEKLGKNCILKVGCTYNIEFIEKCIHCTYPISNLYSISIWYNKLIIWTKFYRFLKKSQGIQKQFTRISERNSYSVSFFWKCTINTYKYFYKFIWIFLAVLFFCHSIPKRAPKNRNFSRIFKIVVQNPISDEFQKRDESGKEILPRKS